jgi:hypothetical protein
MDDRTTQKRLRWVAIATLLIVAVLLVVPSSTSDQTDSVEAEDSPARTLVVSVVRHLDVAGGGDAWIQDGGLCLPYGATSPWGSAGPQLVVTDHTGRVVGVKDVGQGTWETRTEGISCVVHVELSLADAPFYTFAVADVYERIVLQTVLARAGWSYEIEVETP